MMVDWQITATTIYCDAVNDEVTLLVYKDGTAKCTGYAKYSDSGWGADDLKKQNLECQGMKCHRVIEYRDGLLSAEESGKCGKD